MELKLDDLVNHLDKIRTTQGDSSYQSALKSFAKQLLASGGKTPEFLQQVLDKLGETAIDLTALQEEADKLKEGREKAQSEAEKVSSGSGRDLAQVQMDAMRQQMPNLKTQAQFDLTMSCFESIQHYLNAAFGQDARTPELRDILNKGLDLAPLTGDVTEKLRDYPEATSNPDFVKPPKEYSESSNYQKLMGELEELDSQAKLIDWYADNKPLMDGIVSQKLRNALFDAIRRKRKIIAH